MADIRIIGNRMRLLLRFAVCFCCTLFVASVCYGGRYTVIRVYSGDTIKAEDSDGMVVIRLAGIDAPETSEEMDASRQPFSEDSRVYLSQMIFKKTVDVVSYGYDIDNQIIGIVFLDGKNVNLEMVAAGMAEVYPGKTPPGFNLNPFRDAEKTARLAQKGIWSLGDRYVSPDGWRKQHETPKPPAELPALKETAPEAAGRAVAAESGDRKGTATGKKAQGRNASNPPAGEKRAEQSTRPKSQVTVVTGIHIDVGPTSEKVFVTLTGFSIPKAFDIDGKNPRIVIDIWNVVAWKGPSRIPSNGKLIRQIRTYLHKDENKLRIVLDLNVNPFRDYSIAQVYDVNKNTYQLEIR